MFFSSAHQFSRGKVQSTYPWWIVEDVDPEEDLWQDEYLQQLLIDSEQDRS